MREWSARMLERIEIENLGSIRKASVPLSPLTVLLGANASGKTTVLRGIELFAKLRNLPWPEVTYAGAQLTSARWPDMLNGGDATKRLIFRGFVRPDSTEPDYEMQLGIDWERVSASIVTQAGVEQQAEPEFLQERLRDPRGRWIIAGTGEYSIRAIPVAPQRPRHASVARTVMQLGGLPHLRKELADLINLTEAFGTARYFRPDSSAMLVLSADGKVWPNGAGFVAALAALQNRESERFESIEQCMSELFPHIRRIRFDISFEGKIQHLVFETHRSARKVPASMEADGVLTTLFLLWAGATTPPHGTLLIDEPEAALHPHLMGKRVEFLRNLANGEFTGHPLRVVVATQSVDFVRWLEPSEIRVVEHGQDTGTLVHTIPESETLRTLVDRFQANAGDLWYSGALGGVPGTGG
jgi:hypothetical protein